MAEGIGTALLLTAVVGSGIMGEHLAAGNTALALLANSVATGAALVALILTFGPVSGAHFNPVVTLTAALRGQAPWNSVGPYVLAQLVGGLAGVMLAHAMFAEPHLLAASTQVRSGGAQWLSESVATCGLLTVILSCSRHRPNDTPLAVGLYIAGAYWFTASTSFANPAVTLARTLTPTFAGIRPADAPAFIVAQAAGTVAAIGLCHWLLPEAGHPSKDLQ